MPDARVPVEVFCCYARADEAWRQKLERHLSLLKRQGLVFLWHDRLIVAGTDWAQSIDQHLESASIILLLVSADFFADDYSYGVEMKRALERHQANEARVIPILLRPVDWKSAPFAHLQALPTDAKPLSTWNNKDAALADAVTGIRRVIEALPRLSTSPPPSPEGEPLKPATPSGISARDITAANIVSGTQIIETQEIHHPPREGSTPAALAISEQQSGKGSTPRSHVRASITVSVLVLLTLSGIVGVALHQSQLNICNATSTQAATSTQDPTATSIPPDTLIRLIHRYATANRYFDGFPTFEQANYGHGDVYNAVLLKLGGPYIYQDVPVSQLDGTSDLSNVANRWRAIHRYATANRYFDGFPTFEQAKYDGVVVYNAVLLKLGGPYIHQDVPRSQLQGTPDLSDVASSWRAIHRYASASANRYSTGFPTFEQSGCGHGVIYGAALFKDSPFIELRDVPVESLLSLE